MALDLSGLTGLSQSFASGKPTAKILDLDLALIDPDPSQPRKQFDTDKLNDLAHSIEEVGLIQPIVVRKNDSRYIIVAGERRYRAFQLLKKDTISCIIKEDIEPRILAYIQMAENLKRENLSIEEVADFVCSLLEVGEKQNDVAQMLGMSKSLISEYASWKYMPELIREAIRTKKIESIQAAAILNRKWKKDPDVVEDFIKYSHKISRAQAESFDPQEESLDEDNKYSSEGSTVDDSFTGETFLESNFSTENSSTEEINDPASSENESGAEIENIKFEEPGTDDFLEESTPGESSEEQSLSENQKSKEYFENNSEALTEDVFKKPVIFCLVDGRECELLYRRKAADGLVYVRYEDGSESEVLAEKISLNRICEE